MQMCLQTWRKPSFLIAHRGFPEALLLLKSSLESTHPALPKENSGSKWPKTTLGALRDKQRLTPDQLEALNRLCRSPPCLSLLDDPQRPSLIEAINTGKKARLFSQVKVL